MRRALLAFLLTAGAVLVGATPAHAGGPTSVLLTNPAQGKSAALYYLDSRYTALDQLLHDGSAATSGTGEESTPAAETFLNVTWLIHDVSVWRTEQVALDRSGQAWIATWTDTFGEEPTGDRPVWYPLADGDRIRHLASSLGLLDAAPAKTDRGEVAAVAPEITQVSPAPPPVVREETRWFTLTGWRWAVPGLLLGMLAATAALRRGAGPGEPRQELVDRSPGRVTAPG